MRVRGFVLGVVLVAAVGLCMVQESMIQTRARYTLAELSRREAELQKSLERLRAQEESLRGHAYLAEMLRKKKMELVALRHGVLATPANDATAARLPGDVQDDAYNRADRSAEVLAVRGW